MKLPNCTIRPEILVPQLRNESDQIPGLLLHLLANGVLDHHCIGVDGKNNVGGSNLCIEKLNVLAESSFKVSDPHLGRLPLSGPHPTRYLCAKKRSFDQLHKTHTKIWIEQKRATHLPMKKPIWQLQQQESTMHTAQHTELVRKRRSFHRSKPKSIGTTIIPSKPLASSCPCHSHLPQKN